MQKAKSDIIRRLPFWLTLTGVLLILFLSSAYLYMLTRAPFSFEEMDFDGNDFVTFSELYNAISGGIRDLKENENPAREVFRDKTSVDSK